MVVDVVGGVWGEVAERVVGDPGEMDDGVEAAQVLDLDVADVEADRRRVGDVGPEDARGEQVAVQADHLVPGVLEDGDHHRP